MGRLLLQEQLSVGQRLERFGIEVKVKGRQKSYAKETTGIYKRLLWFPKKTDEVKLIIPESRDRPALAEFGIYKASPVDELHLSER